MDISAEYILVVLGETLCRSVKIICVMRFIHHACQLLADALESGMQETDHFSMNSAFSEGWVVKCVCGAKKDDGKPMIECEECKVCTCTTLPACLINFPGNFHKLGGASAVLLTKLL